jgi:NFU1 iron-sulfur cluster scaffold homolog, mitochondrial
METTRKHPIITYAESTPNPAAMKFVANVILLENGAPLEFTSAADAKSSPLAMELFKFPFVKSVFIAGNYITVFKDAKLAWDDITLELREFLREYLSSGKIVVNTNSQPARPQTADESTTAAVKEVAITNQVDHSVPQTETEQKIIATLEQYIRPAVEQDGGMIVFKSFKEGVVSLLMRGACSGCPSSTITLKAGIQAILKKFVPEVTEVVSEG